jgi:hypothetical protein
MILILTDQEDHYLCLPELRLKLAIGNGSIVALASAYLDHFVEGCQGFANRYSLLFISQRQTARYFQVETPALE